MDQLATALNAICPYAAIQLLDGRGNMLATRAAGTADGQER